MTLLELHDDYAARVRDEPERWRELFREFVRARRALLGPAPAERGGWLPLEVYLRPAAPPDPGLGALVRAVVEEELAGVAERLEYRLTFGQEERVQEIVRQELVGAAALIREAAAHD